MRTTTEVRELVNLYDSISFITSCRLLEITRSNDVQKIKQANALFSKRFSTNSRGLVEKMPDQRFSLIKENLRCAIKRTRQEFQKHDSGVRTITPQGPPAYVEWLGILLGNLEDRYRELFGYDVED